MSEFVSDRTAILDEHVLHTVAAGFAQSASTTGELERFRPPSSSPVPVNRGRLTKLGTYQIGRPLGAGGMGAVYEAVDLRDNRRVAVKVLGREAFPDEQAISRFQKEARLLAEVRHPHVTNLVDVGAEQGTCYLVMELVDGIDLKGVLVKARQLPERVALQIAAQVAEALCGAHARGIVHRDIKPGNILLAWPPNERGTDGQAMADLLTSGTEPFVKLTDFGLARHIQQSVSLELTRTGMLLGTPYYAAPEQCSGVGEVRQGCDVYALGATLFEMLCGRPPFVAADPVKLLSLHCFEEPPDPRKLNPAVSDAAAQLTLKALAKHADQRQADAAQLLAEIDRLLRGETQNVQVHPKLPDAHDRVTEVCWDWELESSAETLWPLASNTERINCAVGVPAVEYRTERDEHGALRKVGTFKLGWSTLTWEEHPFEWVEGRRLGVLREFHNGPFQWFVSIVDLSPRPGGGTHLRHTVRIATRGLVGRLLAHVELNVKGRKALDRVYRRMDDVAAGRIRASALPDPFQPPATLGKPTLRRFDARRDQLEQTDLDQQCIEKLLAYLQSGPSQELARIRPRALASRLHVSPERLTDVCLQACRAGLMELHWDILCPTCRVPSIVLDTLRNLERHSYCEACDLDFEIDFQNAVELIFRVHPELRPADLKTYCIGGPEHAPHVVAQVRLAPGEAFELDVQLEPGAYVLRGPQLPYTIRLDIQGGQDIGRLKLPLSRAAPTVSTLELHARRQLLLLENKLAQEQVVRLERTIPRSDVVTAAQAVQLPLFRTLFPEEAATRNGLSTFAARTFLALRVVNRQALEQEVGAAQARNAVENRLSEVRGGITALGGTVVRHDVDELLATFSESLTAVRTAMQLLAAQLAAAGAADAPAVELRAALHQGTSLARTMDGRIDLASQTVATASALLDGPTTAPLVLSEGMVEFPEVIEFLASNGCAALVDAAHADRSTLYYQSVPESDCR